ncbi:putative metal ion binding protein [Trypoxylus dichotomus]
MELSVQSLKTRQHQLNYNGSAILLAQALCDVTLACDGEMLRAHQTILSACSPYFEMLLIKNAHPHPIIYLKDVNYIEMKALLDFMYKGEVNVSQNLLPMFLKTAEALQIRGLTDNNTLNSKSDDMSEFRKERQTEQDSPPHEKRKRKSSNNCDTPTSNPERYNDSQAPTNYKSVVPKLNPITAQDKDTANVEDMRVASPIVKQEIPHDGSSPHIDYTYASGALQTQTQNWERVIDLVEPVNLRKYQLPTATSPTNVEKPTTPTNQERADSPLSLETSRSQGDPSIAPQYHQPLAQSLPKSVTLELLLQDQEMKERPWESMKFPEETWSNLNAEFENAWKMQQMPYADNLEQSLNLRSSLSTIPSMFSRTPLPIPPELVSKPSTSAQAQECSVIQKTVTSSLPGPIKGMGRKGSRFRPNWLDSYVWLQYEEQENRMYCKFCRKWSANLPDIRTSFAEGSSNFRVEIVNHHDKCKAHRLCVAKELEAETRSRTGGSLSVHQDDLLSSESETPPVVPPQDVADTIDVSSPRPVNVDNGSLKIDDDSTNDTLLQAPPSPILCQIPQQKRVEPPQEDVVVINDEGISTNNIVISLNLASQNSIEFVRDSSKSEESSNTELDVICNSSDEDIVALTEMFRKRKRSISSREDSLEETKKTKESGGAAYVRGKSLSPDVVSIGLPNEASINMEQIILNETRNTYNSIALDKSSSTAGEPIIIDVDNEVEEIEPFEIDVVGCQEYTINEDILRKGSREMLDPQEKDRPSKTTREEIVQKDIYESASDCDIDVTDFRITPPIPTLEQQNIHKPTTETSQKQSFSDIQSQLDQSSRNDVFEREINVQPSDRLLLSPRAENQKSNLYVNPIAQERNSQSRSSEEGLEGEKSVDSKSVTNDKETTESQSGNLEFDVLTKKIEQELSKIFGTAEEDEAMLEIDVGSETVNNDHVRGLSEKPSDETKKNLYKNPLASSPKAIEKVINTPSTSSSDNSRNVVILSNIVIQGDKAEKSGCISPGSSDPKPVISEGVINLISDDDSDDPITSSHSPGWLEKHQITTIRCFHCNEKVTSLKNHLLLHHTEADYICSICAKVFKLRKHLMQHMKDDHSE